MFHHGSHGKVKPLALIWSKYPSLWGKHNTLHVDDLSRNFELNKSSGVLVRPFSRSKTASSSSSSVAAAGGGSTVAGAGREGEGGSSGSSHSHGHSHGHGHGHRRRDRSDDGSGSAISSGVVPVRVPTALAAPPTPPAAAVAAAASPPPPIGQIVFSSGAFPTLPAAATATTTAATAIAAISASGTATTAATTAAATTAATAAPADNEPIPATPDPAMDIDLLLLARYLNTIAARKCDVGAEDHSNWFTDAQK